MIVRRSNSYNVGVRFVRLPNSISSISERSIDSEIDYAGDIASNRLSQVRDLVVPLTMHF